MAEINSIRKVHFITSCIIEKIKEIYDSEGIAFIVLKGPHLAYTVYDNPYDRIWGDLDILVEPNNFLLACKLLINNGFRMLNFVKGRKATYKYYYQHSFVNEFGIVIELHRYLSNLNRFPVDINGMIKRKENFFLDKVEVYGLGKEDLLISLIIHFLKSYFDVEQKHLDDIKNLIQKKYIDWNKFLNIIKGSKIKIGSYYVLLILKNKYSFDIPDFVFKELCPKKYNYYFMNKILNFNNYPDIKIKSKYFFLKRFLIFFFTTDKKIDAMILFLRYFCIRILDIIKR